MNLLSWPHDTYAAKCHYTWRSRGRAVARSRCRVTGASIDRPTARPRPLPAVRDPPEPPAAPGTPRSPRRRDPLADPQRGGGAPHSTPTRGLLTLRGDAPRPAP